MAQYLLNITTNSGATYETRQELDVREAFYIRSGNYSASILNNPEDEIKSATLVKVASTCRS